MGQLIQEWMELPPLLRHELKHWSCTGQATLHRDQLTVCERPVVHSSPQKEGLLLPSILQWPLVLSGSLAATVLGWTQLNQDCPVLSGSLAATGRFGFGYLDREGCLAQRQVLVLLFSHVPLFEVEASQLNIHQLYVWRGQKDGAALAILRRKGKKSIDEMQL